MKLLEDKESDLAKLIEKNELDDGKQKHVKSIQCSPLGGMADYPPMG